MLNETKIYVLGTLACLTILGSIWLLSSFGQANHNSAERQDQAIARAIYQQDVDHFSNDARAMSPRDWGNVESTSQQKMPQVTFDSPQNPATPPAFDESTFETRLVDRPQDNEFRPVEFGTTKDPNKFYENQPLVVEPADSAESNSSPLPLESGSLESSSLESSPLESGGFPPTVKNPFFDHPVQAESTPEQQAIEVATPENQVVEIATPDDQPLASRMEDYQGPANQQGLSIEESDNERYQVPTPTYDEMVFGKSNPYMDRGRQVASGNRCGATSHPDSQMFYEARNRNQERRACRQQRKDRQSCSCSNCRSRKSGRSVARANKNCNCGQSGIGCEESCGCNSGEEIVTYEYNGMPSSSTGCLGSNQPAMIYNPDLGFRDDAIVGQYRQDSPEVFPFEEEDHYPSMREILSQSVYFAEVDFMFLEPAFGGNTAFSSGAAGNYVATPFNFDLEPAFRVMAGYESEFGPGLAGEYFQFDNNSDFANFTSDGTQTGETSVYQLGPNSWTRLIASNAGESIQALHSLEVHSTSVYAFKALKFKRAYVNGRFGLQIASIRQKLEANLINGGGAILQNLTNEFNVNAFGPRFGIDYFRKVGHTPLQIVSSATGSILFGDRDQVVANSMTGESSSVGADEFITHFDIFFGVQARRHRGEKQNTLMRIGFVNQSWIGGGTAIDPNDDFGFQGLSFTLGFNR